MSIYIFFWFIYFILCFVSLYSCIHYKEIKILNAWFFEGKDTSFKNPILYKKTLYEEIKFPVELANHVLMTKIWKLIDWNALTHDVFFLCYKINKTTVNRNLWKLERSYSVLNENSVLKEQNTNVLISDFICSNFSFRF